MMFEARSLSMEQNPSWVLTVAYMASRSQVMVPQKFRTVIGDMEQVLVLIKEGDRPGPRLTECHRII